MQPRDESYQALFQMISLAAEKNFETQALLKKQHIDMRREFLGRHDMVLQDEQLTALNDEFKDLSAKARLARGLREKARL